MADKISPLFIFHTTYVTICVARTFFILHLKCHQVTVKKTKALFIYITLLSELYYKKIIQKGKISGSLITKILAFSQINPYFT